jgi:phosphatidate phosphatase APP1
MSAPRVVPLLLLLPLAALAEPVVLLSPAVGSPRVLTANGRVLRARPSMGHGTVGRNLRRLTAPELAHAVVQVYFGDLTAAAEADGDGDFTATFQAPEGRPFAPGWHGLTASVRGASATARALVLAPEGPALVISDFDDTVAVTGVTRMRELLASTFGADEFTQAAVPGMADFYQCLSARSPAPGFALVSGSPIQYLGRVRRFLEFKGFPPMALELRRLRLGTLRGFKPPVLRRLLAEVPNPVVLVGDSGERDPEVYRALAAEFPGRVLAIYIRRVGPATDPDRFEGQVVFEEPAEAARDAARRGLADAACVARRFP